jgi:hypothetical protein
MAKVRLKNKSGVVKTAKVGFSWTTFFFGGWVAMFRGQWGEVLKWFFLNPITLGFWGLVQCWTTNKKTIIGLLKKVMSQLQTLIEIYSYEKILSFEM